MWSGAHVDGTEILSQRIFIFRRNALSFPFVRVCNSVYAGFDNRFNVN
jgi:hypothetical protein